MKTPFVGKFAFIAALLLLFAGSLSAKTDTLGSLLHKTRWDTTEKVVLFEKFTWNVHVRYTDGKTENIVTAKIDSFFKKKNNIDSAHFSTNFYVDTPALNKLLSLHTVVKGSVKAILNGRDIIATGKFAKKGNKCNLLEDKYVDIQFRDTLASLDISYTPYKTKKFELSLALYPKEAVADDIQEEITDDNMEFAKGSYYLAFGIVFLILFSFLREQTENLYFSLFCLFASLSYLWGQLEIDWMYHLDSFFGIFCFEFLSIFFCKILANREKSKKPLIVMVCLMLLCALPFVRYGGGWALGNVRDDSSWVLAVVYSILYPYTLITTFIFLVRGAGQKRWEARAVIIFCLVPLVIFVIMGIVIIVIFAVNLDNNNGSIRNSVPTAQYLTTLLGYLSDAIVFLYPLAAVFILGKRNGLNQLKLAAQVKSIRELSEENLAKEVEKKEILESQNETLEKEVALRTAEIVAQKEKIERQHDELKVEKHKSDDLLRNILPLEVAEELKANGTTAAKHYDNVTVLFTDFVNFTKAGERMSPQGLIDELHACFKAFDDIMGKYGIEKIKTIGDAYLAVCGLPASDPMHAQRMVQAAVEINAFMADRMATLGAERTFRIRIGVHSGSVVAGIVGVKKFAYDIWGDTVNTAARMEQHGEAGKINISETTYNLVKDKFTCEYRGEVEAKGKGVMKMYFVQ